MQNPKSRCPTRVCTWCTCDMWSAFWCTNFAVETAQDFCYHAADPHWSPLASPCCRCLSSTIFTIFHHVEVPIRRFQSSLETTFMPSHQHQQTRWSSPGRWWEMRDLRIPMNFHQIVEQKWQLVTTLRPKCDAILSPWGKTNGNNMVNWHSQENYIKQIRIARCCLMKWNFPFYPTCFAAQSCE